MAKGRKTKLHEIGPRFKEVREALNYSQDQMADRLGVVRTTYTRYELGETFPGPHTLAILTQDFDVSLDWLICRKGPRFYREKTASAKAPEPTPGMETAAVKELLNQMARIPLLHYQVLGFFHEFKLQHPDLLEPPAETPEK